MKKPQNTTLAERGHPLVISLILAMIFPTCLAEATGGYQEFSTRLIQEAINAAQPGEVIELEEGIYRGRPVEFVRDGEPGKPITLTGAPGAKVVIKGSTVIDQWEAVEGGSLYRHRGWKKYFGEYSGRYLNALDRGQDEEMYDYDARSDRARNQVFINGDIQREVARFHELTPGTFYIDRENETIYLRMERGKSPDDMLIEVSAEEESLLQSSGKNYLHIKNLSFEHLANRPQGRAMVRINDSSHILIDNLLVQWAAGTGITISNGSNLVIRNSTFNHNGQMGLHSSRAVDALVENSETSFNNHHPDKQFVRWEFGGLKVSRSRNFVFDGHTARDNRGSGIWFDIDNQNAVIRNSTASGNRYGIHYEISYSALIYNNIIVNNRVQNRSGNDGSGIYIASSAGCLIFNNVTYGNDSYGISLGGAIRSDGAGREVISHSNLVFNNIVAFNQVRGGPSKSYNIAFGRDITDLANSPELENSFMPVDINRSDHNLFYIEGEHDFFIGAGSSRPGTLEKWQEESGQDLNSIWADPLFVDPASRDFRLTPGSPAVGGAKPLKEITRDIRGVFRPQNDAPDIGAYELPGKAELSGTAELPGERDQSSN